jgi:hypothetical protein
VFAVFRAPAVLCIPCCCCQFLPPCDCLPSWTSCCPPQVDEYKKDKYKKEGDEYKEYVNKQKKYVENKEDKYSKDDRCGLLSMLRCLCCLHAYSVSHVCRLCATLLRFVMFEP